MSWDTAINDLRIFLSDGPKDKYRYRQTIFPNPGKNNMDFKTFDFKRLTDFSKVPDNPFLGVFKNGVRIPNDKFVYDDLDSGQFSLDFAPIDGDKLEATFYIQWFLDSDLETFLRASSTWLGFSDDFTGVPTGLQPSAKHYAASEAYQKLATRFSEKLSSTYRVQDQKDPETEPTINSYFSMSSAFLKNATDLRNNFYERQGQPLSPLFGVAVGNVPSNQTKF